MKYIIKVIYKYKDQFKRDKSVTVYLKNSKGACSKDRREARIYTKRTAQKIINELRLDERLNSFEFILEEIEK